MIGSICSLFNLLLRFWFTLILEELFIFIFTFFFIFCFGLFFCFLSFFEFWSFYAFLLLNGRRRKRRRIMMVELGRNMRWHGGYHRSHLIHLLVRVSIIWRMLRRHLKLLIIMIRSSSHIMHMCSHVLAVLIFLVLSIGFFWDLIYIE